MARLTRTQKFAALREELANSSEQTTVNNDLNKYQDKLNSLQSASENVEKNEEYDIKVEPLPTFNEVKEEVKEEEKKVENDFFADFNLDSINEAIDKIVKQNVEIIDNSDNNDNKVEEKEPVVEEVKPVEVENINSLIDQTLDELTEVIGEIEEKVEPEVEVELVTEEEPIVVPERIEEPYNYIEQDYADIAELLKKEVLELNGPVEPVKEEEEVIVEPELKELTNLDTLIDGLVVEEEIALPNLDIPEVNEIVEEEPELQELPSLDSLIDNLAVEEDNAEEVALPDLDIPEVNEVIEEPIVNEEIVETTEDVVLPDLDIPEVNELIEEPVVEEVPELVEQPVASENVALPEVDAPKIDEPVVEEPSVDPSDVDVNSLLDKTLEEVADYNTQAGRLTVDENLNSLIEDVRHGGFNDDEEDDDFSNTVTLEIDKVLSEINLEPVTGPTVSLDEVLDNTVEVDPIDAKREKAAEKLADTLTHPVLTKTLEESPVEIKTLDETFTKDLSTTATLSFKKNEIAEDDDYYYDDDKPNKVLNVVLIVLLVIFLIIVGVIVYFLLLAKGIL
ncbi:MAG: hypothetical protein SPE24_01360 [Erysipelotrichaceae bacterium]|nr:hypothetical protein [Erysipelotrichaceae bacterium]